MSARDSIPDGVAAQAARWMVRLSAADGVEREAARQGLADWIRQDPVHEAAARRMELVLGCMQELRGADALAAVPARAGLSAAFEHTRERRMKQALLTAVAFLFVAAAGWATLRVYPWDYLMADARSATGEWHTRVLEDGTRVTLASGSAVNLRFDARRREIELVRGQVMVEVAKDASRPFVVRTQEARLTALGTRYVVDRHDDTTVLTMIESRVRVEAHHGETPWPIVVQAGQRVAISARGIDPVQPIDAGEVADAWRRHQLVARDRPLTQVLDELDRYRPGRIFYNRAALTGVRMAVVLPLDDPDRALRLLTESVPGLTLTYATPYLVWVDKSASATGH